jgi:diguanylate cyclase (GGDEF)-like protein/PAS domain S-box-containing protein
LPLLASVAFISVNIAKEATKRHESYAEGIAENAIRTIDSSISSTARLVDLSLDSIVSRIALLDASSGLSAGMLSPIIQAQLERLPELDGIHISDAEGIVRWGSGVGGQTSATHVDRPTLAKMRAERNGTTVITRPYLDQISKRWVLGFLRRYDSADGSFGGAVSITVPLSHFERLLSNQHLGEHGVATLRDRSSGALIARHPAGGLSMGQVGDTLLPSALREFITSSAAERTFPASRRADGVVHLLSVRKIDGLPFLISADVSSDGYADVWLGKALNSGLLFLVPLGSFLLAVYFLSASRAQRKQSTQEMARLAEQLESSKNEMRQLASSLERRVEERTEEIRLAASIVEHTSEGAMVTDDQCVILAVNPAFEAITGYTAKEVIGQTPRMLKSDRHGPDFYRRLWRSLRTHGSWNGELWNRHKSGAIYLEHLNINTVVSAEVGTRYVGIFSDITDRYQNEERLRHLAFHDALTGLANRALIMDRLEHALERSRRSGTTLSVMLFDLDGFKAVNDQFGHEIGDLLLQEVARCVGKRVRRGADTLARLGGDEFLILLEDVRSLSNAPLLAEQIVSDVASLNDIRGCPVKIGASMGIANFPDGGTNAAELVKSADEAMYQAKDAGKGCFVVFRNNEERDTDKAPQD